MSKNAATTKDLAIEGCRLELRVEGRDDGPVLVLSHMLGVDLTLWDALVPELGKHFRVVRYDTRGHGGSEAGEAPVTLARLGRDVVAILDALGIERAHFCGESMGGAVGLWLLVHAPNRIDRAVIAGSAAKLGTPAVWNARIAAALTRGMDPSVAPTIERWFGAAFAERAPEPVEAIRALLRATSPEGYAACCGALRDMDLREAVRGVSHPVLVVRGTDDPSVTAQDTGDLVEAMAGATALELDARHCVSIEAEAAFAAAVVKFLTAKAAPRRAGPQRSGGKAPLPRPKPSARRVGKSGGVAARRPVARTVPVSGKAVAKASAARKTAPRKAATRAAPVSPRRIPAEATPRTTTARAKTREPKAGAFKTGSSKPGSSKPGSARPAALKAQASKAGASKAPKVSGRVKAAAAPAVKAGPARPAPVAAKAPVARTRPTTAAALRAATRTPGRATPTTAKASRTKPVDTKSGKTGPTKTRPTKPAATGASRPAAAGKVAAKASPPKTAPAKTALAKASPAKTPPAKASPAKTRLAGAAAKGSRPKAPGRGAPPTAKPPAPGRGPGRRRP